MLVARHFYVGNARIVAVLRQRFGGLEARPDDVDLEACGTQHGGGEPPNSVVVVSDQYAAPRFRL